MFFSKNYSKYAKDTGASVWYLYDENYILPVLISEKITIKYGLFVSEPMCYSEETGIRKKVDFLNVANQVLAKEGVAWISTAATALFDAFPDGCPRIPFGSHIIDLTLTEETLLKNMHSKHRNAVRRAERNGVSVVCGREELIEDYLKADIDTWERGNRRSYGKAFFEKIISSLAEHAVIYVSYKDNAPQAGACFFKNKKMCYYMYGASINNPEPGAANFLQWSAIKDMKIAGVEKFSFVGCRINEDVDSKYHGIQRFKERFGGELEQGYMFKTILSPVKYNFFRKMYQIKKGVKPRDAVDQEIHKWAELQKVVLEDN